MASLGGSERYLYVVMQSDNTWIRLQLMVLDIDTGVGNSADKILRCGVLDLMVRFPDPYIAPSNFTDWGHLH